MERGSGKNWERERISLKYKAKIVYYFKIIKNVIEKNNRFI